MDVIIGKKIDSIDADTLRAVVAPYQGVLVDVGTGSGTFAYAVARRYPQLFCIGIDAVSKNLQECSSRIHRKSARGGVENAMFIRAAVEQLPVELTGMATHITVNLPWGSLLRGIVLAQPEILKNLLRIAAPGATLEFLIAYSALYEPHMMASLGLPNLTPEYLERHLITTYQQQDITVHKIALLDNVVMKGFPSNFARRLAYGRARQFIHILASACKAKEQPQSPVSQPFSLIHELLNLPEQA